MFPETFANGSKIEVEKARKPQIENCRITTEIILKKKEKNRHLHTHRDTDTLTQSNWYTEEKAIIFTTNREGEYI